MKDDRREEVPNVQLWSREGFGGPLSVLVRPTNGTEYISVQGPHAPRRACSNVWFRPIKRMLRRFRPL